MKSPLRYLKVLARPGFGASAVTVIHDLHLFLVSISDDLAIIRLWICILTRLRAPFCY